MILSGGVEIWRDLSVTGLSLSRADLDKGVSLDAVWEQGITSIFNNADFKVNLDLSGPIEGVSWNDKPRYKRSGENY